MDKPGVWARRWLPSPPPRNDLKVEVQLEDHQPPLIRQAFAEWGGAFNGGKGTVTTNGGGLLKLRCSLASQLAGTPGADPGEVLAAVHAASFCMALVTELSAIGIEPRSVHTTATVKVEKQVQGLDTTQLDLEVNAWIPGVDRLNFARAADNAKDFWQRSLPFKGKLTLSVNLHAW
jgi:osmotically inducible protein OsmC